MRIESSSVALAGARIAATHDATNSRTRAWVGDATAVTPRRTTTERAPAAFVAMPRNAVTSVAASAAAAASAIAARAAATAAEAAAARWNVAQSDKDDLEKDPRLLALIRLVEQLTGHKIDVLTLDDVQPASARAVPVPADGATRAPAGWGAEITVERVHEETEQTAFTAGGTVETGDGKQIEFDLGLIMSRQYSERSTSEIRLGEAVRRATDPLVLSLDGRPTQLSASRTGFDLNADGVTEQVALPASGSAFLALDRNGNGLIDDGSELFGPASGDGFAELAALDEDGNGWIDEADSAFTRLRLWNGSGPAPTAVVALADAGIGAIFTGGVSTPFDLRSGTNEELGRVRSSGVYLTEDGRARAVQQVDLTA